MKAPIDWSRIAEMSWCRRHDLHERFLPPAVSSVGSLTQSGFGITAPGLKDPPGN